MVRVQLGFPKLIRKTNWDRYPFSSIVVAVRNEERNIDRCLSSLLLQNYPRDRYEVIIVNDHSTDGTLQKLKVHGDAFPNLKILSAEEGRNGKPAALARGIEEAKGEIILTTDADCTVSDDWIATMIRHFTEGVVLVAGPVLETGSSSFFAGIDSLEFLGLICVGAGLIGSKRPMICNGANLAYRRDAFFIVGGFGSEHAVNDDEMLMNRMVMRGIGTVDFAWENSAVVSTKSTGGFVAFFRQRMRWAGKKGHYEDWTILLELCCLYLFFASVALCTVLLFWRPELSFPLAVSYSGKMTVDYLTVRVGAKFWEQRIPLFHFFVAELLHVPYILIAAAAGQIASLYWRGRKINP
jgi:cellulose synthase/poly-beta-1,6-N-acetylglucosamine synthase-like glycosyltransferase